MKELNGRAFSYIVDSVGGAANGASVFRPFCAYSLGGLYHNNPSEQDNNAAKDARGEIGFFRTLVACLERISRTYRSERGRAFAGGLVGDTDAATPSYSGCLDAARLAALQQGLSGAVMFPDPLNFEKAQVPTPDMDARVRETSITRNATEDCTCSCGYFFVTCRPCKCLIWHQRAASELTAGFTELALVPRRRRRSTWQRQFARPSSCAVGDLSKAPLDTSLQNPLFVVHRRQQEGARASRYKRRKGTSKCGVCGKHGHNKANPRCPMFQFRFSEAGRIQATDLATASSDDDEDLMTIWKI